MCGVGGRPDVRVIPRLDRPAEMEDVLGRKLQSIASCRMHEFHYIEDAHRMARSGPLGRELVDLPPCPFLHGLAEAPEDLRLVLDVEIRPLSHRTFGKVRVERRQHTAVL